MLIIEGSDLVGKTTLCKELVKLFPRHVYAHFTRLPEGFDCCWGYVARMSKHVVQDRFHISELVYSEVRGDATKLSDEKVKIVEAYLALHGAYTVIVHATPEVIESRWRDGEMYAIDRVLKANELFRQYVCDCRVEVTTKSPNLKSVIDTIVNDYVRRQLIVEELYRMKPVWTVVP